MLLTRLACCSLLVFPPTRWSDANQTQFVEGSTRLSPRRLGHQSSREARHDNFDLRRVPRPAASIHWFANRTVRATHSQVN